MNNTNTKTKRFLRTICKVAGHETKDNYRCQRCGFIALLDVTLNGRIVKGKDYYVAGNVVVFKEAPANLATIRFNVGKPTWVSQQTGDGVRRGFKIRF